MSARLESKGTHAGFRWAVVATPMGHRCGYVQLHENHPWYGKGYDEMDADVHGGLTFGEHIEDCDFFPEPGFWIGFDCNHCWDRPDWDLMDAEHREMHRRLLDKIGYFHDGEIRSQEYVEDECRKLANACRLAEEGCL